MIDNLTFEILKRVVANVGAAPDAFGIRGLADSNLALQKTISIRYDDGIEFDHSVHAGKLQIGEHELRALLVNLSVDDIYEFLFVFRMGTMPIHAIKVVYNNTEESFIKIYHEEKDKWIVPSMHIKARLLSDFEQFVSWGLLWNECKEVSDLYKVVIILVEDR